MSSDYKVIIEKEYKQLSSKDATIGLLMMVKNEEARILVSLESVIGSVDAIIIYDTGSTDKTVEIIQAFCEKEKINLYMIQGTFVNFATSRNVSLDYADKINVQYLLLLDCNDELRGGKKLKEYTKTMLTQPNTGFLVCQEWWSGCLDKYFNIRLVKARSGWRYRGSVHEWMKDTTSESIEPTHVIIKIPDNIVIYQDRTKDNNKSGPRFKRDYDLLLQDYKDDPKNSRTIFYLAQTCLCLSNFEEALYYSKLRIEEDFKGYPDFEEEKFLSYIRCGDCCKNLQHDWYDSFSWYMKAYEHTQRAEPLVKIADHYRMINKWAVAYMYIKQACELSYPDDLILFVDRGIYDYYRWHVMSIVASHVNKHEEGRFACLEALKHSQNKEVDEDILKFYTKQEKPKSKQEFIAEKIHELKQKFPTVDTSQLQRRAEAMWKKRNKK